MPNRYVVGPGSSLTRTGVYFGFARVLPQDPDDPSLTDSEDVDIPGSSHAQTASSSADFDDDDDNEVVLGASPIGDMGEGFLDGGLARPRQNSRGQPSPASVLGAATTSADPRADKEAEVSRSELSNGASNAASAGSFHGATRIHLFLVEQSRTQEEDQTRPSASRRFAGLPHGHERRLESLLQEHAQDRRGPHPARVRLRLLRPRDPVVVLGYVRPEYNYDSMDALIEDIEMDKKVTVNSLARPLYQDYSQDPFLGR
ncbi:related to FMN1 - Riboflavin kinase [Moesziomyces antarcticus]|uniref:Riboflavin kinase n=1 Tax=Pseudozyma antarctica TaxID=84753 RepID=A0A5C3FYD9_PSEA2|nr:related to FMN1 - Riboflavin kinase [Moesziomyces antarcticus]